MAKKVITEPETEHSPKYETVKKYYEDYLETGRGWDKNRVHAAVGKWITAEEYEEITGEPYEA